MHVPEGAVETSGSFIWIDDGVVITRAEPVTSTAATVAELFEAIGSITGQPPLPILFDARDWSGGDPGAWATAVQNLQRAASAVAMFISADSTGENPSFSEAIDRLLIPFRVFAREDEARAFLADTTPR